MQIDLLKKIKRIFNKKFPEQAKAETPKGSEQDGNLLTDDGKPKKFNN